MTMPQKKKVLLIYTGGTIGMERVGAQGPALKMPQLKPDVLAKRLRARVPELKDLAHCDVDIVLNCDSAHIGPTEWELLAERIQSKWRAYDGVVIMHGTDTLAYTASALSMMLRPCLKPVIITGSQRPLSALRTDARRNLISAVEIAAHGPREQVGQVCVFFDDKLFQGNRVRKRSASQFEAFESPQARPLAVVGTEIVYASDLAIGAKARRSTLSKGARAGSHKGAITEMLPRFSSGVTLLHVTPGFPAHLIREQLLPHSSGLVLVVFSSGTAPTHDPEFLHLLKEAKARGVPIVVATEGAGEGGGAAQPKNYEAGRALLAEGAYWAGSMTPECAYVKTTWLLAQPRGLRQFGKRWNVEYAGEGK